MLRIVWHTVLFYPTSPMFIMGEIVSLIGNQRVGIFPPKSKILSYLFLALIWCQNFQDWTIPVGGDTWPSCTSERRNNKNKARYTLGTCNTIHVLIKSIIKFKTKIGVLPTRICKIMQKTKLTLHKTLNSKTRRKCWTRPTSATRLRKLTNQILDRNYVISRQMVFWKNIL